jgi:hypothetical protein
MKISKTRLRIWLFVAVIMGIGLVLCLSYPAKADLIFDVLLAIAIAGGFEYLTTVKLSAFKRRTEKNPLLDK